MTLDVTRTSPTTLLCSRYFAAAPARVWAAHMEPDADPALAAWPRRLVDAGLRERPPAGRQGALRMAQRRQRRDVSA